MNPSGVLKAKWFTALAVLLVLLSGGVLLVLSERQNLDQAHSQVQQRADQRVYALQQNLESSLSAVYALAAVVQQAGGEVKQFHSLAEQMLRVYPGIRALQLAPEGTIRHIHPYQANEAALGLNLFNHPLHQDASRQARDTRRMVLVGPVQLVQGGQGLVGRYPVYLDGDRFWGFAQVVIDVPVLLEVSRLNLLAQNGYAYLLTFTNPRTDTVETIARSAQDLPANPLTREVAVPTGKWTLQVAPQMGWLDYTPILLKSALVLLISSLVGMLVWLTMRQPLKLGQIVEMRTRELGESLALLEAIFDATSDAMLVVDASGRMVTCNAQFLSMWGTTREELQTHTGMLLRHPRILARISEPEEFRKLLQDSMRYPERLLSGVVHLENGHALEFLAKPYHLHQAIQGKLWAFQDVTQRRRAEERVQTLAYFDRLTLLPNRAYLEEHAPRLFREVQEAGALLAFMYLDLDHFKTINDSLGPMIGDRVLHYFGQRIKQVLTSQDLLVHLSGDEFVVLLPHTTQEKAENAVQEILRATVQPFTIEGRKLQVTVSIGLVYFPQDGTDLDVLLRNADIAMHQAKSAGRNIHQLYVPAMSQAATERLQVESDLRRGLENSEFMVFYQPIVHAQTGECVAAEALIRWMHPEKGMVPPIRFIPVAEATGLILPLGRWILNEVCRQNHEWRENGLPMVPIGVNFSALQFRQNDVLETIQEALERFDLPAQYLQIELTESLVMQDVEKTTQILHELSRLGVMGAIDDFGTGYSSLAYLKRFPIRKLKIDRSFVRDLTRDPDDQILVKAMIDLARNMHLHVVAEGVEEQEQHQLLAQLGCHEIQGYLISRPVPARELQQFLQEARRRPVVPRRLD